MTVATELQPWSKHSVLRSLLSKTVKSLVLISSMTLAGQAFAAVPVVESQPSVQTGSNSAFLAEPSSVAKADAQGGTAYLLNVVDQLRSEMMELRGLVEEQGFLIKQLEQENRDRYLDLDERISRMGGSVASGASVLDGASSTTVKPSVKPASMPSSALVSHSQEEEVYQKAFQLIRDKRFDEALTALNKLLVDFPSGVYADNAQYWLGEVHMAQGGYPQARDAFLAVLNKYPQSPKVPDATYKLGRLSDLLGDKQQAKNYLESVINKYPDTAASRLSDTYLQNLGDS